MPPDPRTPMTPPDAPERTPLETTFEQLGPHPYESDRGMAYLPADCRHSDREGILCKPCAPRRRFQQFTKARTTGAEKRTPLSVRGGIGS